MRQLPLSTKVKLVSASELVVLVVEVDVITI